MTDWRPINCAPTDERDSFLVLVPGNGMCSRLVLQVSRFEGEMYPDHLDANIDYGDRISNATHWAPMAEIPK